MVFKPLVTIEPGPDLRMPMIGIVIENDVNGHVGRDLRIDHVPEPDELLMPTVQ